MLTVLDEYTRQALEVAVRTRMGAEGILEALYPLLLRREVLNAEWFTTTKQAQVVINQWLRQYNNIRPNQALNMRPPVPETLIRNGPELGG